MADELIYKDQKNPRLQLSCMTAYGATCGENAVPHEEIVRRHEEGKNRAQNEALALQERLANLKPEQMGFQPKFQIIPYYRPTPSVVPPPGNNRNVDVPRGNNTIINLPNPNQMPVPIRQGSFGGKRKSKKKEFNAATDMFVEVITDKKKPKKQKKNTKPFMGI